MSDLLARFADDMVARLNGPLHLRFLLQPAVAVSFAVVDGLRDARTGAAPYGWTLITAPDRRGELMRHGWKSIGKVFVAVVLIDVAFQLYAFHFIYIAEVLMVGIALAIVPYVLVRGLAARLSPQRRRA